MFVITFARTYFRVSLKILLCLVKKVTLIGLGRFSFKKKFLQIKNCYFVVLVGHECMVSVLEQCPQPHLVRLPQHAIPKRHPKAIQLLPTHTRQQHQQSHHTHTTPNAQSLDRNIARKIYTERERTELHSQLLEK